MKHIPLCPGWGLLARGDIRWVRFSVSINEQTLSCIKINKQYKLQYKYADTANPNSLVQRRHAL